MTADLAARFRCDPETVSQVRSRPREELLKMTGDWLENLVWIDNNDLIFIADLVADLHLATIQRPDAFDEFMPKRTNMAPACRAGRSIYLLGMNSHPPATWVPALKDIARRGNLMELQVIARELGRCADYRALDETTKVLESPDRIVAGLAREGLEEAVRNRTASPEFLTGIWPACVTSLRNCDAGHRYSHTAAPLLTAIDRDRAGKLFLSGEFLKRGHPMVGYVCRELETLDLVPEESVMQELLDPAAQGIWCQNPAVHGLPLIWLAERKSDKALPNIMRILEGVCRDDPRCALPAWRARFKLADRIPIFATTVDVHRPLPTTGWEPVLDETERKVFLAWIAGSQLKTAGGISLIWFQRFGAYTTETQEGLRLIGASRHAELLKAMCDIIAPAGPVADSDTRYKMASILFREIPRQLHQLEAEWSQLPSLEIQIFQWDWNRSR